jgi:tetratricopeptide (TPR) repeat protein
VFVFDVDDLARRSRVVVPAGRRAPKTAARRAESAQDWFDRGLDLEGDDPRAARAAYRRALDLDPEMSDAYVNLGRLMHQLGDLENAAQLYRQAIERSDDAVAHYDLALVLEDRQDFAGALDHYHHAVRLDPNFADAHFNLGRLLERAGRSEEALRHLLAYRRLTGPKGKGDGDTR